MATPPAEGDRTGGEQVNIGQMLQTVLTAIGTCQTSTQNATRDLQHQMDQKLGALRKELVEKQEAACDKMVKKVKRDKSADYQFRRKGNEVQYKFNQDVLERMEDAIEEVEKLS